MPHSAHGSLSERSSLRTAPEDPFASTVPAEQALKAVGAIGAFPACRAKPSTVATFPFPLQAAALPPTTAVPLPLQADPFWARAAPFPYGTVPVPAGTADEVEADAGTEMPVRVGIPAYDMSVE